MALTLAGTTLACRYAAKELRSLGIPVTEPLDPAAGQVLLDVPGFSPGGMLRDGSPPDFSDFGDDTIFYGGNLHHPSLDRFQKVDFLRDPMYLAQNAAITARCAAALCAPSVDHRWCGCPVLIIGWGRIGKCLGQQLRELGADVTVAARKEADRAMLRALGYHSAGCEYLSEIAGHYRVILNTAPAPILGAEALDPLTGCVLMDLASSPGLEGSRVIRARGLPGKYAPEASGTLIAETWLRLRKE